ncbi:MAG: alpha/beta hydrolase [Actinomycetaceae bacterium]|nr:alpha/beta hydrolase [Actinomycetaceae bacterium]
MASDEALMTRHFDTPQGSISYWINQVSARPSLVFLPGLTADHRLFDAQIEFFKTSCNVLVWDAPGHGASRPFELSFSLADQAAWLHQILAVEGIERPILVGQSMGGYVAQCFLQQFPGEAAGFISIGSAPLQRRYMSAIEIWLLRHVETLYRWYPWQALKRDGAKSCSHTTHGRALMTAFFDTYTKDEYVALSGFGYRMLADAVSAELPYLIDCPASMLCGEYDNAGSVRRYNKAWARTTGIELVWITNAGHNANVDQPGQVNQLIDRFIMQV